MYAFAGGFQAVAIAGFISPLAVALLGPAIGAKLDSTRRQTGLTVANVIQTISITAAGQLHPNCMSNDLVCPRHALQTAFRQFLFHGVAKDRWRFCSQVPLCRVQSGAHKAARLIPIKAHEGCPASQISCQLKAPHPAGTVLLQIAAAGPNVSIRQTYHLPILLALNMSERLSAFASDLLIERSFIPQLAGK